MITKELPANEAAPAARSANAAQAVASCSSTAPLRTQSRTTREFPAAKRALALRHRALQWTIANAAGIGADPARVALVGDSAGNMTAALTFMAKERGGPQIAAQVRPLR